MINIMDRWMNMIYRYDGYDKCMDELIDMIDRQIDRQIDRVIDRQIDRQIDRVIDMTNMEVSHERQI